MCGTPLDAACGRLATSSSVVSVPFALREREPSRVAHTSHVRGGCGGARAVRAFIILAILDLVQTSTVSTRASKAVSRVYNI